MPEPRAGARRTTRFRWWLWTQTSRLPGICPASAHSVIVWGIRDAGLRINGSCVRDCAANTACWCGKLVNEEKTNA